MMNKKCKRLIRRAVKISPAVAVGCGFGACRHDPQAVSGSLPLLGGPGSATQSSGTPRCGHEFYCLTRSQRRLGLPCLQCPYQIRQLSEVRRFVVRLRVPVILRSRLFHGAESATQRDPWDHTRKMSVVFSSWPSCLSA